MRDEGEEIPEEEKEIVQEVRKIREEERETDRSRTRGTAN